MDIKFSCKEDEEDYNHYLTVRGQGVYDIVYDVLLLYSDDGIVHSKDFLGLIRYDKKLRDSLYTFLATVEEYLKTIIFSNYEYKGVKPLKALGEKEAALIEESKTFGTTFFKYSSFDFKSIINFIRIKNVSFESKGITFKNLDNIRKLRNMVMHHNFLLIDPLDHNSIESVNKRVNEIRLYTISLLEALPCDWKEGLRDRLKKANTDKGNKLSRFIRLEI